MLSFFEYIHHEFYLAITSVDIQKDFSQASIISNQPILVKKNRYLLVSPTHFISLFFIGSATHNSRLYKLTRITHSQLNTINFS